LKEQDNRKWDSLLESETKRLANPELILSSGIPLAKLQYFPDHCARMEAREALTSPELMRYKIDTLLEPHPQGYATKRQS